MNNADRELLDHFVRTRERTLELAHRVPDDWLDRTPEGEANPPTTTVDAAHSKRRRGDVHSPSVKTSPICCGFG